MEPHHQLTDQQFEKQFKSCEFPPEMFSHEAHLRLAWIHIVKYGIDQAVNNVTTQLKKYTNQLGVESKYNTTLTIAAIRAVYHFTLKSSTLNFADFIHANPRLKTDFRSLMQTHYSTDIFQSSKAKESYIEPEQLPFD